MVEESKKQEDKKENAKQKILRLIKKDRPFWLIVSALLVVLLAVSFGPAIHSSTNDQKIDYTRFYQSIEKGIVKKVKVSGQTITGEYNTPVEDKNAFGAVQQYNSFVTNLPTPDDPNLVKTLVDKNIPFDTDPAQDWQLITILLLPILFGGVIIYQRGGLKGFETLAGFGPEKRYKNNGESITFSAVAGGESAKRELLEIVDFLKDPSKYKEIGAGLPKGVLLVGPPGIGKTLMARATAGEAGVPFFSISGSEFGDKFIGVGAARVRSFFSRGRQKAPAILFIDEIDSIGRKRSPDGSNPAENEREQILNQLLTEMDGFVSSKGVVVIAATNHPEVLDSALLRPGRFDRRVTLDLPSFEERVDILNIHAKGKKISDKVDFKIVAHQTPGFSGADLANLLNEAGMVAIRNEKCQIESDDLDEARDKIVIGLARNGVKLNEKDRRVIAYHEAGHALVSSLVPGSDPVYKVTILPRGQSLGSTHQISEYDKFIVSKETLLNDMAILLGGRAAEHLVFNSIWSGSENDLKRVCTLANKMVLDWGMSEMLGHVAFNDEMLTSYANSGYATKRSFSEETAREIDVEIRRISKAAFDCATNLIDAHRQSLDQIAELLIEKDTITGREVLEVISKNNFKVPDPSGVPEAIV